MLKFGASISKLLMSDYTARISAIDRRVPRDVAYYGSTCPEVVSMFLQKPDLDTHCHHNLKLHTADAI